MFLLLLNLISKFKQFSLSFPPARALIHLGKRLWLFIFRGKRKGERTYVLKEGEEGKGGIDHLKKEEKNLGYKFYDKQGRRAKKEGEGREGGERKEEAIFVVREDGKSWGYENIVMEQDGASAFIVYIRGTQEGWEEFDTIICHVPHQQAMFTLFEYLVPGRIPVFTSVAEFKPIA